jgi:hypothetical protein
MRSANVDWPVRKHNSVLLKQSCYEKDTSSVIHVLFAEGNINANIIMGERKGIGGEVIAEV